MIDLTEHTFVPELTLPASVNGSELAYGCVFERRMEGGGPGVAGEYRPQLRDGSGSHATIFVRAAEPLFELGEIAVGDAITTMENGVPETWIVRERKGPVAGLMQYLVALEGSRLINTTRKSANETGVRD